jgi:hypothetical protein
VSPVELAVDILATARLTRLVVDDELTAPARDYVQGRWPSTKLAYLVTCPYCMSIWTGVVVVGLGRSPVARGVKRTLALSEATILVRLLSDG